PAPAGGGAAHVVGRVRRDASGARPANCHTVRGARSGARLESSAADRPHPRACESEASGHPPKRHLMKRPVGYAAIAVVVGIISLMGLFGVFQFPESMARLRIVIPPVLYALMILQVLVGSAVTW